MCLAFSAAPRRRLLSAPARASRARARGSIALARRDARTSASHRRRARSPPLTRPPLAVLVSHSSRRAATPAAQPEPRAARRDRGHGALGAPSVPRGAPHTRAAARRRVRVGRRRPWRVRAQRQLVAEAARVFLVVVNQRCGCVLLRRAARAVITMADPNCVGRMAGRTAGRGNDARKR